MFWDDLKHWDLKKKTFLITHVLLEISSRVVIVRGDIGTGVFCPGGFCPGGYCPGDIVWGDIVLIPL